MRPVSSERRRRAGPRWPRSPSRARSPRARPQMRVGDRRREAPPRALPGHQVADRERAAGERLPGHDRPDARRRRAAHERGGRAQGEADAATPSSARSVRSIGARMTLASRSTYALDAVERPPVAAQDDERRTPRSRPAICTAAVPAGSSSRPWHAVVPAPATTCACAKTPFVPERRCSECDSTSPSAPASTSTASDAADQRPSVPLRRCAQQRRRPASRRAAKDRHRPPNRPASPAATRRAILARGSGRTPYPLLQSGILMGPRRLRHMFLTAFTPTARPPPEPAVSPTD